MPDISILGDASLNITVGGSAVPVTIAGAAGPKGDKGDPGSGATSLGFNQSATETIVYDDFDRADGAINGSATPTGETWLVTGAGAAGAKIENGRLIGDDGLADSNFYARLDYGEQIESIAAVVTFESRGNAHASITGAGPQITVIAQENNAALTDMLHLQINYAGWILDKRIGGTWTNGIQGGSAHFEPDTQYALELQIDKAANKYRVLIERGALADTGWVTDTDLASLGTLNLATFQIGGPQAATHAFRPVINAVTVGGFKSANPSKLLGGASSGEITPLKGKAGGRQRIRIPTFTTVADGWHRLFEPTTLSSYVIMGRLRVTARNTTTGAFLDGEYRISNRAGGTPTIEPISQDAFFSPITQIRAHNDGSTGVYVEVNIPGGSGGNIDVDAEFEGWAVPANFGFPTTVSATALTNAKTYTIPDSVAVASVSETITANGWHSLVTTSTEVGGGSLQGAWMVYARRADAAEHSTFLVMANAYHNVSLNGLVVIPLFPDSDTISQFRLSREANAVRLDALFSAAASVNVEVTVTAFGEAVGTLSIAQATAALTTESVTVTPVDGKIEARGFTVDGVDVGGGGGTQHIEIAMSDLYSELAAGDNKASWVVPYDFTLSEVFTAVTTAQSTSGAVTIDIRIKGGSTIFTTPPSIDANEDTSLTGTAAVLSTTALTKGQILLFDLDADGTGAKGLVAVLVGAPT